MIKKWLTALTMLGIISCTSIVNASNYIPCGEYDFGWGLGRVDMPELPYKNAYRGEFWLNNNMSTPGNGGNKNPNDGFYQGQYIDHIDVRTDDANIIMNFYENDVFQYSKKAIVTDVTDILINDAPYNYNGGRNVERTDGVVGADEYNFQIVKHPGDLDRDGKIEYDAREEDYNFRNWLDLTKVSKITIIVTLTVYDDEGNSINYEGIKIIYEGLQNIIENSWCTNGSGLDYHLVGDISHNTIVDIPEPEIPEEPDVPEEEIDFDISMIVPDVGDNFSANNIWLSLISFLLFIITNIKFKGER